MSAPLWEFKIKWAPRALIRVNTVVLGWNHHGVEPCLTLFSYRILFSYKGFRPMKMKLVENFDDCRWYLSNIIPFSIYDNIEQVVTYFLFFLKVWLLLFSSVERRCIQFYQHSTNRYGKNLCHNGQNSWLKIRFPFWSISKGSRLSFSFFRGGGLLEI